VTKQLRKFSGGAENAAGYISADRDDVRWRFVPDSGTRNVKSVAAQAGETARPIGDVRPSAGWSQP
jgi:hypothetical protein